MGGQAQQKPRLRMLRWDEQTCTIIGLSPSQFDVLLDQKEIKVQRPLMTKPYLRNLLNCGEEELHPNYSRSAFTR